MKRMKPGKVTGPNDVAVELWKSMHWYCAEWLTQFFNQIIVEKNMPAKVRRRIYNNPNVKWKGAIRLLYPV